MIIYTKNFEEAKKMLNVAMAAHYPKDVDIAIFVDDGLTKGITVEESNIDGLHIKRTYFTTYQYTMDLLQDIFDTVNINEMYCIDNGGIKLKIRYKNNDLYFIEDIPKNSRMIVKDYPENNENPYILKNTTKIIGFCVDEKKEGKEEMKNEKDYYELKLSDITVTPDDMEKFSESVTSTFKKKIAEHMGMNPLIGMDYLNGVTEAAAYGFSYAVDLLTNRLFEKARKPERYDFIAVPVGKEKTNNRAIFIPDKMLEHDKKMVNRLLEDNKEMYRFLGEGYNGKYIFPEKPLFDKLFPIIIKYDRPIAEETKKPNKLTAENKSKLLAMLDTFVARPTPEELKNEKITLTYAELEELIQELFSVG